VVGGGPAGLECARRLAERGHRVELHEAGDRLGGMLRVAEAHDADLLGLADWLAAAAVDAGVEVHLRSRVAAAVEADVVVWAAGVAWPDLRLPDGDDAVAVLGAGGPAVAIARTAARSGRSTTLVADGAVLAPELGLPGRFRAVHDARAEGVREGPVPDGAVVVDARRGTPGPAPPGAIVIGDAAGTEGLAAALRAAADVAAMI
jgi:NADPH-dependent glutamate synthase beta subunit-like oxidoreductase